MFIHVYSTYIKLDTPHFYKVHIETSVHGWPAAAAALMIVRFVIAVQVPALPPREHSGAKADHAVTIPGQLHL